MKFFPLAKILLFKSNQNVLDIFGVDLESITNSLCTCTITVGNEVMKKNLSLNNVEKETLLSDVAETTEFYVELYIRTYLMILCGGAMKTSSLEKTDAICIMINSSYLKITALFLHRVV